MKSLWRFTETAVTHTRFTPTFQHVRRSSHFTQHCVRFSTATNATQSPLLLEQKEQGVYVLTFNRPAAYNAMNIEMASAFAQTIQQLKQKSSNELKALIVTGAGKAFSAGGDWEFLLHCAESPERTRTSHTLREFYGNFISLLALPVPTIAAINGVAVGGGACLSLLCDMRIAAKATNIQFNFAKIGLHPGMGSTHLLPHLIGADQAARLFYTAETVNGEQAHKLGMVTELVDESTQVLPAALQLATAIASNSTDAVRTTATTMRLRHHTELERALTREADAQSLCFARPGFADELRARRDKKIR